MNKAIAKLIDDLTKGTISDEAFSKIKDPRILEFVKNVIKGYMEQSKNPLPITPPIAQPMQQPMAQPMPQPMPQPMFQPMPQPMPQSMIQPMSQPMTTPILPSQPMVPPYMVSPINTLIHQQRIRVIPSIERVSNISPENRNVKQKAASKYINPRL